MIIFSEESIDVHGLSRDVNRTHPDDPDLAAQIDLLVTNSDVCVLVEVKSQLSANDVDEHLVRMDKFRLLFPEYQDKTAYGAVAAMSVQPDVGKYAYRKGIFVIAQSGDTVILLSDTQFYPKSW